MISIVGLGPGNIKLITDKGKAAIAKSDVLIGGKRNLQSLEGMFTGETLEIGNNLREILQFIKTNYLKKEITVVASGDPMLYGIGKYLSEQLEEGSFEIVSGISATTYMFSQIPMNMNDVYITSSHGKVPNFPFILAHEKVAMVTDDKIGPYEIAREIIKSGLNKVMWIGENLSYDNERITRLKPGEVLETKNYEMNVVVIVDENSEFITGNVPITKKEEVRAIAINKLDLKGKKTFLDVGAGTGSVCVEVARTYDEMKVYAVECKEPAIELIKQNRDKFELSNMEIIEGYAPVQINEKMDGIFIGGTGGNLEEIIKWCYELLNEGGKIVANFIILDTFNECLKLFRKYGFEDIDATMLSVSKLDKLGKGEYFKPFNPIFLIEATKK